MPDNLYLEHEYEISRSDDGATNKSGSLTYWSDEPVSAYSIGDTFNPIPGVTLKVNKVAISDSVLGFKNGRPHRQWKVTIDSEGSGTNSGNNGESTNDKFTFDIAEDGEGGITKSGTWQITRTGAAPTVSLNVGDTFSVPGVGDIVCTKVSGSDSYSNGERQWTVTYEGGSNVSGVSGSHDRYTFDISKDSDGITTTTGTRETTCTGNAPTIETQIGESFNVPYIGAVVCAKISTSDEFTNAGVRQWTITYEGTVDASGGGGSGNLPESEDEVTYEINGITVRSVSGEFLVLRRNTTPITRKSLTRYTATSDMLTTIGGTYENGIVKSEKIVKETIKKNGTIVSEHYRHDIEVES